MTKRETLLRFLERNNIRTYIREVQSDTSTLYVCFFGYSYYADEPEVDHAYELFPKFLNIGKSLNKTFNYFEDSIVRFLIYKDILPDDAFKQLEAFRKEINKCSKIE